MTAATQPAPARPVAVLSGIPTWEDCEEKLRRSEKLTALEKFVMDNDWDKNDHRFRDGIEAVFDEIHSVPPDRVLGEGEERISATELATLRKFADSWESFRAEFDDIQYHHEGMGCGIEDRGIHDRYQACEHGWDCAMERVTERFPEFDTLDALRAAKGGENAQ